MAMDHKFLKETWASPTAIEFHELGEIVAFEAEIEKITWTWEFTTIFSQPARRGVLTAHELGTKKKITSGVIARNSNQAEAKRKASFWVADRLQRKGFRS